jgi:hypothetical protein
MLNYKINKINNNYIHLKKNFDLLYFKELLNNSLFIIYFNYSKIYNKNLYSLKNEILKKNLKSYIINSKNVRNIFEKKFKFLNSTMLFIFCNSVSNFLFISELLNNINFFYLFNKCFSNIFNNNIKLNNSLNIIHFVIFKLLFNLLIIILFYVINFIKSINYINNLL